MLRSSDTRAQSDSDKWHKYSGRNILPMWIADTEFLAAPAILDALQERLEHGVFGYGHRRQRFLDAIKKHCHDQYGWHIEDDWIQPLTGVVPGLNFSRAVAQLRGKNQAVMVEPVYPHLRKHPALLPGFTDRGSPCKQENGRWVPDFAALEANISADTGLLLLCHPHNPIGRAYSDDELARYAEIAQKHDLIVCSDEIHCDLTDPGAAYVPFASVSETCAMNSVTCVAASKAFNIAGLHTAAVFSKNPKLHAKIDRQLNTDEVAEPNVFACIAAQAAFTKGGTWLDELRAYIFENKKAVREFIKNEIPEIFAVPSNATYLLWLDCSKITEDSNDLARFIRSETGLYLTAGAIYGGNGRTFLRMNVACPRATLDEALDRLEAGVTALLARQALRTGAASATPAVVSPAA